MDNYCVRKDNNVVFGINIATHVTFLFTILTLLFVFYTSKILEKAINNQVIDLIEDKLESKDLAVKDKIKNELYTTNPELQEIQNLTFNKIKNVFDLENTERANNNNFVKAILFLLIIAFIVVVIISIVISKGLCTNVSVKEILIENIVIFTLIGIIEITFFLKIILKYIPAYPSTLAKKVVKVLKEI